MAGAFELMAKTGDFTEISRTMAATAAQLAKAKADADKQVRKAEEEAMSKVDDFVISDKRKYTQKYQPYAQKAMMGFIDKVSEDKKNYPNTWTNLVNRRMVETEAELVTAFEQSEIQRDIQKKAEQGYMVPQKLLQAYNSNYGDVSDIVSIKGDLSRYGIDVGEDGSVGIPNVSKPINIQSAVEEVRKQKGGYETRKVIDKKTNEEYTVTTTAKLLPEELSLTKQAFASNRDLRRMYLVEDDKFQRVMADAEALQAQFPQADPKQLEEMAITRQIEADVDKFNFSMGGQEERLRGKGMTINVGGDKPRYPSLQELTYTNATIGGAKRAGVDVRQAQIKQGMPETKATRYLNTESKMINPKTGAELDAAKKDAILNSDVYVNNVYNKDGVPTARVSISIPASGVQNIALKGITEFEIPLEKSDDLEQSITATFGDMLTKNGYSSIYDYVKSLKAAGGAAPARPAAAPTQQNTYRAGSLN